MAASLEGKEWQVFCGFSFWASKTDGSQDLDNATPSLRSLSSVEASYVAWPEEADMPEKGRGKRLLAEKADILSSVQTLLTDDGRGYDAERENYESAEACATVAVLMELATRDYQPLPDSLFQLQGAYVTLTARGPEGVCTKDSPSEPAQKSDTMLRRCADIS